MKRRTTAAARAVATVQAAPKKDGPMGEAAPLLGMRPYQSEAFWSENRGEVWLWARQVGKSRTLASWAISRLLDYPGRLVTILSNTKDNGIEVNLRVAEICQLLGQAFEQADMSDDARYENMRLETRISVGGKVGRIKVLAASPRTARGFSGDLIMDEFAFHENSRAIWDAAEPIISSNPDYYLRIASTPNGKHNMFYEFCTNNIYPVRRVTRTLANAQGARIYHPFKKGVEITPAEARALAPDKKSYDQNYELVFADENSALLTYELIARAETPGVGIICEHDWSSAALALMKEAIGPLFVGVDVGRQHDLTVIWVWEQVERLFKARAILRIQNMRLPAQQERLGQVLMMPHFRKCKADMTGLGVGLVEYAQDKYGRGKVEGVNFGTSVPITNRLALEGRKNETARVTEVMATEMVGQFEDNCVRIMPDPALREGLRKPERIVTATGRVSIAATRDEAGHADEFWAGALGLYAARSGGGPFTYQGIQREDRQGREVGARATQRGGGCLV